MRRVLIAVSVMVAVPAYAGNLITNDGAIVFGPDATWHPDSKCEAPSKPTDDAAADMQDYQVKLDAFVACVRSDAAEDKRSMADNIDRSVDAIQNQQQDELYEIQKITRSAANRLNVNTPR